MTEFLPLAFSDLQPEPSHVLRSQGVPARAEPSETILQILSEALRILAEISSAKGILTAVTTADFERIYEGEGKNDPDTPLAAVFPRASHLALYAVTLGGEVSRIVSELFRSNDFAVASMLDAAASEAVDRASRRAERYYLETLRSTGEADESTVVLGYSPGYCGWHVSGQSKLFAHLHPERIGITLRESFLMEPLKSMSGVLVAGPREIHHFDIAYPFCNACKTRDCRARIRALG